jgi:hypothetical protein
MKRSLKVIDKGMGAPLAGMCTACKRKFVAKPKLGEDPMEFLLEQFNDHKCKEDASQAAARIVREATENR